MALRHGKGEFENSTDAQVSKQMLQNGEEELVRKWPLLKPKGTISRCYYSQQRASGHSLWQTLQVCLKLVCLEPFQMVAQFRPAGVLMLTRVHSLQWGCTWAYYSSHGDRALHHRLWLLAPYVQMELPRRVVDEPQDQHGTQDEQ